MGSRVWFDLKDTLRVFGGCLFFDRLGGLCSSTYIGEKFLEVLE
jgi:hypothetical protein